MRMSMPIVCRDREVGVTQAAVKQSTRLLLILFNTVDAEGSGKGFVRVKRMVGRGLGVGPNVGVKEQTAIGIVQFSVTRNKKEQVKNIYEEQLEQETK